MRTLRRALAATCALAQAAAASGLDGTLDALRGGTYVMVRDGVRFVDSRVVVDATASGARTTSRRGTRTRLRLSGRGVASSRLTVITTGSRTRVAGTVAGRRVAVRAPPTRAHRAPSPGGEPHRAMGACSRRGACPLPRAGAR